MPGRVVLGVGAGIAAYKSCELLRLLTESGHSVRVIPTPDALRFVGEATWAALSGEPVTTDVWTSVAEVPHVRLGQSADLVLIVPATADLMARAAAGMAGDLLTATVLTARCPVIYAPAMHTEMWEHPATAANVSLLRDRGAIVLEPASGRLTGADSGPGRLPEPAEIFAVASRVLARRSHQGPGRPFWLDLAGRRVVVSAGGTREEIDPVRFIGNWSSGTQGYALARAAVARGAEVVVVAANVALPDPAGVKVVRVISARDMADAVTAAAAQGGGADAVVMAAAVADYRPAVRNAAKLKKDGQPPEPLALTENPDILSGLAARRAHEPGRKILVGFAAETDTAADAAQAKLSRKGCDLLVVNPVGNGLGFGAVDNEAVVYGADGTVTQIPRGPKEALADVVWDLVSARLG
ncbi:MAG: bifunctional phosphopantothenoylcysteine decarboxylase/phosphopantothenate--cysteine ligase CoaBC [Streptosporangiaceae bacterium]|jgi:phosphopantothenoylcysteine decarboxylase/phosphopantothenate--cysteine ligase